MFLSECLTFPRRSWETLETWDCCWPCWQIEETQSPTLATAGATWSRTLSSDSSIRESSWSEGSQAEVASFEQGESQTLGKWSETILKAVRVIVVDRFYCMYKLKWVATFDRKPAKTLNEMPIKLLNLYYYGLKLNMIFRLKILQYLRNCTLFQN